MLARGAKAHIFICAHEKTRNELQAHRKRARMAETDGAHPSADAMDTTFYDVPCHSRTAHDDEDGQCAFNYNINISTTPTACTTVHAEAAVEIKRLFLCAVICRAGYARVHKTYFAPR
jgi:hypothetical protein